MGHTPGHTREMKLLLSLLLALVIQQARGQNMITCTIMREAFPDCSCTNVREGGQATLDTIVDCSNKNLVAVPVPLRNYDRVIKVLLLNNNSINELTALAFQNIKAESIDLRGNAIANVSASAFEGVDNALHTLYLQGTGQNHPPKESFVNLGGLTTLYLSNYNAPFLDYRDRGVDNPFSVFRSLRLLKKLTLHECKLDVIEPLAFSGPTALEELVLTNNDFRSIPVDGIEDLINLAKLTITGSRYIVRLNQMTFHKLASLQELDLSDNSIEYIHPNATFGLSDTLEVLRLSRNVLKESVAGLTNLASLRLLDLSENIDIKSIPDLSGLGARQPISLDLSKCSITQLRESNLRAIAGQLGSLDLSGNQLVTIEDSAFRGALVLEKFAMTDQQVNSASQLSVPSSLKDAAQTMKSLKLSGRPILENSLWSVVSELTHLEVLDLTDCELSSVPSFAFERLTRLKELYLGDNQISNVNQNTMVGPRFSLELLNLAGNSLSTLPSCLIHQYILTSPLQMSLNANSFVCDCRLRWLKTAVNDNSISFVKGGEPQCRNGQLLLSLSDEQLSCTSSYRDPECDENYQTTPSPTGPGPTTPSRVDLTLSSPSENSIVVAWVIDNSSGLQRIIVTVTNQDGREDFKRTDIPPTQTSLNVPRLEKGTSYRVCVTPVFPDSQKPECSQVTTQGQKPSPSPQANKGSGEDVGVIVGAIVGGVVLLVLIAAIVYLVFLRRKPKTPPPEARHVQPRTFTKQELPSMAQPKPSMQVVAISDGMPHSSHNGSSMKAAHNQPTPGGPPARVGRAHLLTSEGSNYKDMTDLRTSTASSSGDTYENDRGPLPNPPKSRSPHREPNHAYYNDAFSKYDEVSF